MKKSKILWDEFLEAHKSYLCGHKTFKERAQAFIKFKTAFIAGE